MKKSERIVKWEEMIPDLLIAIASSLNKFHDYVFFRGVCKTWRNVATKELFFSKSHHQLPKLMIVEDGTLNQRVRNFYSLTNEKSNPIFLPELHRKRYFETLGWLVIQEWTTRDIELFHPFSRVRFPLPAHNSTILSSIEVFKAVLSSNPSFTQNYMLVVMNGARNLAFWRPGQKTWNHLRTPMVEFEDIIFYKNQFHVVDCNGRVYVIDFDLDGFSGVVKVCTSPNPWCMRQSSKYLAESDGALLIVSGYEHELSTRFEVFEVDIRQSVYKKTTDLGNRALFVGRGVSSSVDTCRFPMVKPNYVYCSDFMGYEFQDDMKIYSPIGEPKESRYSNNQGFGVFVEPIWVHLSF